MEINLQEAILKAVEFMAIAARTAPKAAGKDFIKIKILSGDDLERLAQEMAKHGIERNKKNFDRDGDNVKNSAAVLLLSLAAPQPVGLNCGACGQEKCAALQAVEGPEFKGPLCAWRVIDLGIALGSAVKTASIFNLDNRIMYRIGVAARRLGLIEGELVVGVPVSASGKSIYFDR